MKRPTSAARYSRLSRGHASPAGLPHYPRARAYRRERRRVGSDERKPRSGLAAVYRGRERGGARDAPRDARGDLRRSGHVGHPAASGDRRAVASVAAVPGARRDMRVVARAKKGGFMAEMEEIKEEEGEAVQFTLPSPFRSTPT